MELIEHRQKRLEQDPVLLTSIMPETSDIQAKAKISSLEFRKVVCEGVYDESKSIYIGPRSRSVSGVTENGYYVVTPLMPVQQNGR
jgi:surfeit locus 1 family protein